MHKFISFNGEIIPGTDAKISGLSSAALYGKGVFTTVAIKNKKPFLWEKHWRRLQSNAKKAGLDTSVFLEDFFIESLYELIEKNGTANGRARITLFDERASRIWDFETPRTTSVLMTTADRRKTENILDISVSPFSINSVSPLAGVKSCNYLENTLALEEAEKRGYAEAVRLNEKGEIASACMANVFWVKNENVFTPALETGCLAGTTREFLIENFPVREVLCGLQDVANADFVFLTSAGIGICQAVYERAKPVSNPLFIKLKDILDNAEQ